MADLIGDLAVPFVTILPRERSVATIIPHATLREVGRDELVVVDQPVQTGSTISDHAFRLPAFLQMEVAWSCSTGGSPDFDRQVYAELLALQRRREPFDVSTGKRAYSSMLPSNITLTNTQQTENAAFVTLDLRELILVKIGGAQGGGMSDFTAQASPDAASQANPASTLGTVDSGQGSSFAQPYGTGDAGLGTINSGQGGAFADPYSGNAPPLGSPAFSQPVDPGQFQSIEGRTTFGVGGIDSQYDYTPSFVTPDSSNDGPPLTVTRR